MRSNYRRSFPHVPHLAQLFELCRVDVGHCRVVSWWPTPISIFCNVSFLNRQVRSRTHRKAEPSLEPKASNKNIFLRLYCLYEPVAGSGLGVNALRFLFSYFCIIYSIFFRLFAFESQRVSSYHFSCNFLFILINIWLDCFSFLCSIRTGYRPKVNIFLFGTIVHWVLRPLLQHAVAECTCTK